MTEGTIQFVLRLLFIVTITYALIALIIVAFQRKMLFQTVPYSYRFISDLEAAHFRLATPDGENLDSVWLPSANADAAAILYLHGNAANLRCREGRLKALADLGYSILAIDWRGYGKSTGRPSQEGLLLDAETAYQWLVRRTDPSRIVVFAQ